MADRQRRLMMFSAAPGMCGVLLLMMAGCRSYSPYGYGYPAGGGYPPVMGGPAGGTTFITPGSVPGSPVMPGQPIASPPSGSGGGGTPIGGRPSLSPTGGGDGGKQVPNYNDPNDPGPTTSNSGPLKSLEIHDDADFQGPLKEKNKLDELKNDEEDEFAPGTSMNNHRLEDDFADPMPVQTASFAESAPAVANDSRPNPYAHKADFGWVRGVADFDAATDSWYVVYNPEPDPQDPYNGSLTLAPHSKLKSLHPNEVVLVTGKIDQEQLDRFGKPKYTVTELNRLRPKAVTGP